MSLKCFTLGAPVSPTQIRRYIDHFWPFTPDGKFTGFKHGFLSCQFPIWLRSVWNYAQNFCWRVWLNFLVGFFLSKVVQSSLNPYSRTYSIISPCLPSTFVRHKFSWQHSFLRPTRCTCSNHIRVHFFTLHWPCNLPILGFTTFQKFPTFFLDRQ